MSGNNKLSKVNLNSLLGGAGVLAGPDLKVKPQTCEFEVSKHYVVTGENMIFFDKKSLKADGWKLGSFLKVSDDGTQASFSIKKKCENLDETKVEGSIILYIGGETETLIQKMKVGDKAVEVGPFKVNGGKSKGFFGGEGLHVKGEINKIQTVKVLQNGKELDRQGSCWSDRSKAFNFKGLKGEIEISISYWPDLKKTEVSFSI